MTENKFTHQRSGFTALTEIAAIIAIVLALGALWLANQAHSQVDTTFEKFTKHLAKQVHDAQSQFAQHTNQLETEVKSVNRSLDTIRTQERDHAEKINSLTQRLNVLEHELKTLTASIPPQYLRRPKEKKDRTA